MNIKDYRQAFYDFSTKSSDVGRQIALAGIAIVWLFKRDLQGVPTISASLYPPLILLALGLTFDLSQYTVATVIWRFYYRSKEKQSIPDDKDLGRHSIWLEVPIWSLFVLKLASIAVAYVLISKFLVSHLVFS